MLKLKAFWLQQLRVGFVSFSSTRELFRSRSNRLGFLEQIRWSRFTVHCASWRTLEQQGREDDEGKGQRLAVDAKSDVC
jgi:hypothetical protein